MVDLNRELLARTGNLWDSTQTNPLRSLGKPDPWIKRAVDVLDRNYAGSELFVVKDPTLCLTLPVWLQALAQMDIAPRLVAIHRSPLSVADSLRSRNGFSREKSLLIWLAYNWSLVTGIANSDLPLAITDYDELMAAPEAELSRVLAAIHLEPDAAQLAAFAREFVDPSLRHSQSSLDDLSSAPEARLAHSLAVELRALSPQSSQVALRQQVANLAAADLGERIDARLQTFLPKDRSGMVASLRTELDDRSEALRQALGWQEVASRLERELVEAREQSQTEIERLNMLLNDRAADYEKQISTGREELAQARDSSQREIARLDEEKVSAARVYQAEIDRLNSAMQAAATRYESEIGRLNEKVDAHQGEIDDLHGHMNDVAAAYESQIKAEQDERTAVHEEYSRIIEELESSWSYRLGRVLTWPIRWPLAKVRGSETGQLLLSAVTQPRRTLAQVSPRRVFNFLDILVRRRGDLLQTFRHYRERLDQSTQTLKLPDERPVDVDSLSFQVHAEPRVSVIIPIYNQLDYTLGCLQSISDNLPGCSIEIIVADDCSTDDSQAMLSKIPGVRYTRNPKNLQFLLSVNQAAQQARGEYVFLLNNDTRVLPGWLDSLVELLDSKPDVGVTGSRLLYPDGRLQEAGGIVWNDASAWNFGRLDDPEKPEYNYLKEVDYISGAALMVRRELFEQVGYFDERYVPAYYEDTDLCFAVRALGYRVMLQPASNVVHFEGISHGTDTESGVKQHQVANQQKFLEKWQKALARDHFPNAEHVFLARDRSRHRRTVLVVDHYVPHFDRDAGSRSTWQYLKLLVDEGFNVKFMGDNFYRHEPYTTHLEALGIEVLCGSEYARGWRPWLLENARYIDVMYLHRPHITEKYLDTIAGMQPTPRTIYFGHDLHYLRLERQAELEDLQALREKAADWRRREFQIFDAVDLVYYPSQVEIDCIHEERPALNAKAIPLYVFDDAEEDTYAAAARDGILFIGGFNHPPNADAILWFSEIFESLAESMPGVVLHIVGSCMPPEVEELASDRIRIHGFLPDAEVDALYRQIRLSVVPLRFGAGIKGKVLESMRKGVPVLTTETGAEGVIEAQDALCVTGFETMGEALQSLYDDAVRLEEFSRQGRRVIQQHYSVAAARQAVIGDFSGD